MGTGPRGGKRVREAAEAAAAAAANGVNATDEELNAAGKADQEVLALELFWVPGEAEEELDADEIILDWPELMPC